MGDRDLDEMFAELTVQRVELAPTRLMKSRGLTHLGFRVAGPRPGRN